MTSTISETVTGERADLVETLGQHRFFLRFTARELDDDQARRRTTASELTIGGLIKHVTYCEQNWARFIVDGPSVLPAGDDPEAFAAHADSFRMGRTRRSRACSRATRRSRQRPTSWCAHCPTWTRASRYRRHRGSRRARGGRPGGCSCT